MPESALLERLEEDSEIARLVNTRIYATEAPPDATLPYIVYDRTGSELQQYGGGSLCLERVELEYECWAKTYAEAKEIASKLESVLLAANGPIKDVNISNVIKSIESNAVQPPLRGERRRIHGVLIEFGVWVAPL